MATSAFRSTTNRTPIGKTDTAPSNRSSAHRRSRSLSRFSRSLPGAEEESSAAPPLRGKFVNTVRGSGFPEISLDDLTVEFFDSGSGLRGRSSDAGVGNGATPASQRRGRSVSRQGSARMSATGSDGRGSVGNSSGRGRVVTESDSRRRRSMSVVRYQISDSESDLDSSRKSSSQANSKSHGIANNKMLYSNKLAAPNHKQGLRRSLSQRDFKSNDGYSSQSSTLTDYEGREAYSGNNGIERTIRAIYAQKKAEHPTRIDVNGGLYEAMRKDFRNAVEEIKMGLEQTAVKTKTFNSDHLQSNSSNALQNASRLRRNHATKQEQSEKRTQDLLTELVLKEQRDRELTKIVKELRPNLKNNVAEEKLSHPRRRSNDRNRMSKRLTEEAEKYFEDFILNLEDTDISSLDGERSDTSSAMGGIARRPGTETFQSPLASTSPPIGTDGVVLPWLQWETKTETSPLSRNNKMEPPEFTKTVVWDAAQEATNVQDHSIYSMSSQGSWSPGVVDGPSVKTRDYIRSKLGKAESYLNANQSLSGLRLDMDDYLKSTSSEEFLFERWCQRERINSGSMVLCNHLLF